MSITVRPVRTRAERKAFFEVAKLLHAGDPIWTPPLREDLERALGDDNPLWQEGRGERELLVAWDGNRPVGRICANVHHASNRKHGEAVGLFGLFETPDEPSVAGALLDAAAELHRARGLNVLRGPFDLTITQMIGAVISNFDEPAAFNQSWNAPHVPKLIEAAGFKPVYLATTHRMDDVQSVDPDALLGEKQRAWLAKPGVTLRTWDMEHFERDLVAAMELLNRSFDKNWGFVALSREELDFMAGPMKRVVRPEITVFIELEGKPVGVAMALPDFNVLIRRMEGELFPLGWAKFLAGARHLDAAVIQFLATSPELQNQGVMRVVVAELFRKLQQAGFRTADGTWIGDVNPKSLAQAKAVGMRDKHRLAVYDRPL